MKNKILFLTFIFFFPLYSEYERPIIVIIPSFNNSQWIEKNVSSVFEQEYSNFMVIYIDDCSSDDTYSQVKQITEENNWTDRLILIHNYQRNGAMQNLYNAITACNDHAIIVTVDGDDWLAHPCVLSYLNQIYENPLIWMTWGQYCEYPSGVLGFCRDFNEIEKRFVLYRERLMPVSHLRTFYAGLFKKIDARDLKKDGKFYTMAWDKAMMGPMLEMADGKFKFISEISYIYNNSNPLNDHRIDVNLQHALMHEIFAKPKYNALEEIDFIGDEFLPASQCCTELNIKGMFNDNCEIIYSVK